MFVGIAVAVVVLIAGVLLAVNMGGDDDDKKEAGDDSTGSSDSADWEDDDYTSIEEVEPDPIAEAVVGDCFFNYGTETTPDLEESWGCDEGSFEVVDLYPGSSDLSSCDSVTLADLAVSYPAGDLVLCLSYQHPLGDAYHAQPGECVFGPAEDDSPWWVTDCQTGAFRVLERLPGVTDSGSCTEDTYYNHYMGYTTSESYLDVMLCMSFIYPDDAGYATMDNCLYMDGDPESDDTTYTFADCDDSNIYVTGRTDEAWASSFCGNHGWNTWESYDFPIHSYTICWQYL